MSMTTTIPMKMSTLMESIMADYGWMIIWGNPDIGLESDVSTMGPTDIDQAKQDFLIAGQGTVFQMFDDDGEHYYLGRIIGDYDGFEPLDDFGMPNAGCTIIKYKNDTGNWIQL